MLVKVHPHRNKIKWGDVRNVSVKAKGPVEYYSMVLLDDVEFKINENARKRVIYDSQRNVHAWAVGELSAFNIHEIDYLWWNQYLIERGYENVVYNPWHGGEFYKPLTAGEYAPVYNAESVSIFGRNCMARGINWKH